MIDARNSFLLFSCAISFKKVPLDGTAWLWKGSNTKDYFLQFHISADIHVFVVNLVWNWQTSVEMSSQCKFFASFNSKMKACWWIPWGGLGYGFIIFPSEVSCLKWRMLKEMWNLAELCWKPLSASHPAEPYTWVGSCEDSREEVWKCLTQLIRISACCYWHLSLPWKGFRSNNWQISAEQR